MAPVVVFSAGTRLPVPLRVFPHSDIFNPFWEQRKLTIKHCILQNRLGANTYWKALCGDKHTRAHVLFSLTYSQTIVTAQAVTLHISGYFSFFLVVSAFSSSPLQHLKGSSFSSSLTAYSTLIPYQQISSRGTYVSSSGSLQFSSGPLLWCLPHSPETPLPFSVMDSPARGTLRNAPSPSLSTPTVQWRGFPPGVSVSATLFQTAKNWNLRNSSWSNYYWCPQGRSIPCQLTYTARTSEQ